MSKDELASALVALRPSVSEVVGLLREADLERVAAAFEVPAESWVPTDSLRDLLEQVLGAGSAAERLEEAEGALTREAQQDREEDGAGSTPPLQPNAPDLKTRREQLRAHPLKDRVAVLRILAWLSSRDERFANEEQDFLHVIANALSLPLDLAEATIEKGRRAMTANEAVGEMRSGSMRHLLLSELVLLAFADGKYDARERTAIRRLSSAMDLPDRELLSTERDIVDVFEGVSTLPLKPIMPQESKRSWRRIGLIAGVTVFGGAVLAVTGGMAAPAVGGAIGALMGLSGAAATSAGLAALGGGALAAGGFGMAGGAAVVAGVLGAAGAATAAVSTARRTAGISEFEFLDLGGSGARVVVGISGWLSQRSDFSSDWRGLREHYDVASIRALRWESKDLLALGKVLGAATAGVAARAGVGVLGKRAIAGAGGMLNLPAALLTLLSMINNPWSTARDKADKTGIALAKALVARPWGARPVTLVGFSLGTRVIHSALTALSHENRSGLVESVILLGGAVDCEHPSWDDLSASVTGPIVNGYCETDVVLRYLYQAVELARPIGLGPMNRKRILDVNLTDLVGGHLDYRNSLSVILKRVTRAAEDTQPDFWMP